MNDDQLTLLAVRIDDLIIKFQESQQENSLLHKRLVQLTKERAILLNRHQCMVSQVKRLVAQLKRAMVIR